MIDLRLLRTDPERVRASQRARGEDPTLVDSLLSADEARRAAVSRFDTLRNEQKLLGKEIPKAAGEAKAALLEQARKVADDLKAGEAEQNEADAELKRLQLAVSNVVVDGVPEGGEEDFVLLETIGTPRDFTADGFDPPDHAEQGKLLRANT